MFSKFFLTCDFTFLTVLRYIFACLCFSAIFYFCFLFLFSGRLFSTKFSFPLFARIFIISCFVVRTFSVTAVRLVIYYFFCVSSSFLVDLGLKLRNFLLFQSMFRLQCILCMHFFLTMVCVVSKELLVYAMY